MFLLDDYLLDLFKAGKIDQAQVLSECQDVRRTKEKLGLAIQ